jgi:hypothetical protein
MSKPNLAGGRFEGERSPDERFSTTVNSRTTQHQAAAIQIWKVVRGVLTEFQGYFASADANRISVHRVGT